MAADRERTVDALGLPIHCLEWGTPATVPLLLVHGFLDHALSWEPFVDCLQERFGRELWIVAPDCRGHGDSGWVRAGGYYHFPDYVFDLHAVVQSLGADRIRLVGHSMGGTISFLFAGTFPAHVNKLVLIEGIGPPGMNPTDAPGRMLRWIDEVHGRGRRHFRAYDSIDEGAKQLQHTNPRLSAEQSLSLTRAAMKLTRDGKWVWKFDPLHRTTSPQPFYSFQAMEFLRRITCPVLLIEGEQSNQTERGDKQARLEALRDRRLVRIENSGHMVHQDNPEALAAAVAEFLG